MGKFPVLLDIKILVVMITRIILEKYSFNCVSRLIWNINLAALLLAPTFYLKLLALALAPEEKSGACKLQLQLYEKIQSPKAPAPALVTQIGA